MRDSLWLRAVWLGAAAFILGCSSEPPEASLAQQAADVRAGSSDRIQVQYVALGDDDLHTLTGLAGLRELLLDNDQNRLTAAGMLHLTELSKLEHLRVRGGSIDDAALKRLADLENLHVLNLPQGTFSDAGLVELKRLPKLVQFRFGSSHVTDAGMKTLAALPAIKRLHLIDVPITDDGVAELAKIEQLESLYIDGGRFSEAALENLFRRRPNLHVHLNQQHHDLDPQKNQAH